MEPSQIVNRETLEKWLANKPNEWARAIAVRAALRVAPITWSVFEGENSNLSDVQKFKLILLSFRAIFIATVISKYPSSDTVFSSRAVSASAALRLTRPIRQKNASKFSAAASASIYAANISTYSNNTNGEASNAVNASALVGFPSDIWGATRTDCKWLLRMPNSSQLNPLDARILMNKPLWMNEFSTRNIPMWASECFDRFRLSELGESTHFKLLVEFYMSIIEGRADIFSSKADISIALMEPKFWGDGEKYFDAFRVMGKIAEIIELENKEPEWNFFLSYNKNDEIAAKRISDILEEEGYTVFSQFNDFTAGKSFVHEMNRGLSGMGRMIAIYSPDYFESGACMSEWEAAYLTDSSGEKGKFVPFLIKACTPTPLAQRIVWKSLQGLNREEERQAVLDFVRDVDAPNTRSALRKTLKETASPDIVVDITGKKLDVIPNKKFDVPFIEEELLELPEILRSLVQTALSGIEQTNCPSTIKAALKAYERELAARGVNCILGVLRTQMDVIDTGVFSESAEYWCSDEALTVAFEKIKEYHLKLVTHYPLDQTRQKLINAIDVDPEKLNSENFDYHRREIIKATADAHKAGEVTDRYRDITENQLTVARDVLDVATPDFLPSDDKEFDLKERDRIARIEDAKKRRLTDVVGTADKSLEVMTRMTKLAESETAKNLLNALIRLGDWFW